MTKCSILEGLELFSCLTAQIKSSMPKKSTYHHGDLRRALLDAALVLLETKDVSSLSLRAVAKQAGVSHTAPYRHFADKADLLAAVAEVGFTTFGQYLSEAVDKVGADPKASLLATGEAYVRYALDHPTYFRVMFSCMSFRGDEQNGGSPVINSPVINSPVINSPVINSPVINSPVSSLQATADSTFQILVDVIESGQATGAIRAEDARTLAVGRWALVHGLAMLLLDGMLPQQEAIALTQQIVADSLAGILTEAC